MKPKKKVYVNIICDAWGTPYTMIVVDGQNTTEIPVTNSNLKTCKKAARDVYGATDIYISLVRGN